MLGGWRKEKDTRLTDVIKKRASRREYDAISKLRWRPKKKGLGGGEEEEAREKLEESELSKLLRLSRQLTLKSPCFLIR